MKRAAVVSPYFPPGSPACVQRARLIVNHLPRFGWRPTVFCVDELFHEQPLDPELTSLVASSVRVRKVSALPARMTRLCGVGDVALRAYFRLRRALRRFFDEEGGDLLFVTVLPGYAALLGPYLRKHCRVPFVLDYQDPWVSDWGAGLPLLSKGGLAHRLAKFLEPRVLPYADAVTAVSQGTCDGIRVRYPKMPPERFSVFPIGGEPADFAAVEKHPRPVPLLDGTADRFNLCCVGTVWPKATATLRAVLAAAAELRRRQPERGRRLLLHFVGTSGGGGDESPRVVPLAEEYGVADAVRETPRRLPYLDALALMKRADALLAFGSDEPHYTASRIFPLLLSRRPTAAVYHRASSVCEILRDMEEAALITFDEQQPAATCVGKIAALLERLVEKGRVPDAPSRNEKLKPYLAENIAAGFAEVFDRAGEKFNPKQAREPLF